MFDKNFLKNHKNIKGRPSASFLLPNQGSNLDFTDPESVVLPITPLGISNRKITTFFYLSSKNFVFFLSN